MKTRITYLFVLCCLLKIGTAQIYFNNRYDNFNSCDGAGIIDTFNNSYITAGFTCSSVSFYALNLRLYDQVGTTTANKTYHWSGNNFQTGKGFVKNGNKYLLSGTRYYKNDTSLVYQWTFDTNLDSLKYSEYGYLNKGNVVHDILNYKHINYFMVGQVYDNLYNSDILLIKTDTAGNEIWKKKIGFLGWDETGHCIKQCTNGDLLIGGLKDHHSSSQQGPFIMRLDTSGAVIWQNYYPSATYANGCFDVTELPNGDIVFTGGMAYNITSNGTLRRPMLTRVDAGGNLIWQKEYGEKAVGHDFFTFLINEKNNFVVSGVKFYPDNSSVGMVYEINQNGDSLFSREYHVEYGSQNYFRDLVQAPDKGYVFSGFITPVFPNGGTGTQDIWLLKTDSTFCESNTGCGYPTGLHSPLSFGEGPGVRMFPNPAQNQLTFNLENIQNENVSIKLTNALGKLILEYKVAINENNKVEIDISNLSNALYYYSINCKNETITNGKFIILK